MKFINVRARQCPANGCQAMTLTELMVSVGVGSLVLLAMVMIFMTSSRSFAAMGNYLTMDQAGRNALDQMTRDIRKAKNLISFTTNELVFNYLGSTMLVYNYDSSSHQLTQWKTGGQTNTLLTGCDSFQFSMYQNIPQPGGAFFITTSVSQAKSISVAWKCSRTVLAKKVNSEVMQEALIVIRNKPVS